MWIHGIIVMDGAIPIDMCLGADAFRNSGTSSHPYKLVACMVYNKSNYINPAVTKLIGGN